MEPPNNGHVGDECFVHYSEVVPSSEVLTCIQLLAGGTQFVRCREVVRSSECPLSEVPLYTHFLSLSLCVFRSKSVVGEGENKGGTQEGDATQPPGQRGLPLSRCQDQ